MKVKTKLANNHDKILAMRMANKSSSEIAKELDINQGTLIIYMRAMKMPKFKKIGDDRFGIQHSDDKHRLPVTEFKPNILIIKKWNSELAL